jgi:2-oxoisovalerate dehydrogenase E2 component (dihydrolipoyl transacylase)
MSDLKEFRLPDVGEGLTEADIVSWHVKPGDTIKDGQVIVEIETAKAVVELPSPFAGTVSQLLVDEGQTVDVGTPIIAVDTSGGSSAPAPAAAAATVPPALATPEEATTAGEKRQAVLVGYGVKTASTTRRPRKTTPQTTQNSEMSPGAGAPRGTETAAGRADAGRAPGAGADAGRADAERAPGSEADAGLAGAERVPAVRPDAGLAAEPGPANGAGRVAALAKPPVRKLAKDLGISLGQLTGTGPAGSITRDDVQRAASGTTVRSAERAFTPAAADERIPVRGVRKHIAAAMVQSAFTAPHVTEFLQVDVTETMAAVRRIRELPEFEGVRVSPLLFVARALLTAVARHPLINSSWDGDAQEILVHGQVNLGIAVAAERGLLVPNVKNAGALPLPALAAALQTLTETARAGKATPADLSGGTITITNVGVFGVDAGTPILTPGEAAILAFGQVRDTPWVVDGQIAVRKACTLSLSFDHRIIDGELGSAALRDVGSMLEDPVRMLAWS